MSSLYITHYYTARRIRAKYPDASQAYLEVGDTAYITFDGFDITPSTNSDTWLPDYYQLAEQGKLPQDFFGILIQAFWQIIQEDSPVKSRAAHDHGLGNQLPDLRLFKDRFPEERLLL